MQTPNQWTMCSRNSSHHNVHFCLGNSICFGKNMVFVWEGHIFQGIQVTSSTYCKINAILRKSMGPAAPFQTISIASHGLLDLHLGSHAPLDQGLPWALGPSQEPTGPWALPGALGGLGCNGFLAPLREPYWALGAPAQKNMRFRFFRV